MYKKGKKISEKIITDPLHMLKLKFATGEIDVEEFQERLNTY